MIDLQPLACLDACEDPGMSTKRVYLEERKKENLVDFVTTNSEDFLPCNCLLG